MDRIAQYRLCLNAESYIKNIMHFHDRECVRTLRPLFVYATATFYVFLPCFVSVAVLPGWHGVASATPKKSCATPQATPNEIMNSLLPGMLQT